MFVRKRLLVELSVQSCFSLLQLQKIEMMTSQCTENCKVQMQLKCHNNHRSDLKLKHTLLLPKQTLAPLPRKKKLLLTLLLHGRHALASTFQLAAQLSASHSLRHQQQTQLLRLKSKYVSPKIQCAFCWRLVGNAVNR
jgi:hypothetical protein